MYSNIDEQFTKRKQEILKSFQDKFKIFKQGYKNEHLAEIDFKKELIDNRGKLDEIIIDGGSYFDDYKRRILSGFYNFYEKYKNPVKLFFEEEFLEIKTKQKEDTKWKTEHNQELRYDIPFFKKEGHSHIVGLLAEKYAIEEYLNPVNTEIEEGKIKEVDFELIELNFPEDIKSEVLEQLYNDLDGNFINLDFKLFQRHFENNKEEIVKINWLGKQGEIKAFMVKLIDFTIIKQPKKYKLNQFISLHFYSKNFSMSPKNLGSVNNETNYQRVYNMQESNQLVQIIKKIKK